MLATLSFREGALELERIRRAGREEAKNTKGSRWRRRGTRTSGDGRGREREILTKKPGVNGAYDHRPYGKLG